MLSTKTKTAALITDFPREIPVRGVRKTPTAVLIYLFVWKAASECLSLIHIDARSLCHLLPVVVLCALMMRARLKAVVQGRCTDAVFLLNVIDVCLLVYLEQQCSSLCVIPHLPDIWLHIVSNETVSG